MLRHRTFCDVITHVVRCDVITHVVRCYVITHVIRRCAEGGVPEGDHDDDGRPVDGRDGGRAATRSTDTGEGGGAG